MSYLLQVDMPYTQHILSLPNKKALGHHNYKQAEQTESELATF